MLKCALLISFFSPLCCGSLFLSKTCTGTFESCIVVAFVCCSVLLLPVFFSLNKCCKITISLFNLAVAVFSFIMAGHLLFAILMSKSILCRFHYKWTQGHLCKLPTFFMAGDSMQVSLLRNYCSCWIKSAFIQTLSKN